MNYFLPILALLLFNGCLYFNDKGISGHLYDNCREYYDACGQYRKECPPNLIDYDQIPGKIRAAGRSIADTLHGSDAKKECCGSAECAR